MGKPAARIGDTTAHGGTVTLGTPTVMIGKMPASAMGDMHVCPMCNGPVPHVGGPITLGSTGVMVGKKPSARISDMTVCVGPPSMPAMGCMTVLIGEVGSGSQAGSAASALSAAAAQKKGPKSLDPFPLAEAPKGTENHYVECEFVDSAGKPLSGVAYKLTDPNNQVIKGVTSSEGKVYHSGYSKSGSFKLEVKGVKTAKWEKEKGKAGEEVKMEAEVDGVEDGADAVIGVFAQKSENEYLLAKTIDCKVSGKKIKGSFKLAEKMEKPKAGEAPKEAPPSSYFFVAMVDGLVGVSNLLRMSDTVELKFKDEDGKPLSGMEYALTFGDGSIKKGKLDGSGAVKLENVPHGPFQAKFKKPAK
jgi:uncharacterized Zn-binding protein involved in type VI secretion